MKSRKEEIIVMTDAIIKAHDGQSYFNFGQASKIIGCGRHTLAHHLNSLGLTVKLVGPSKRISACDIATLMCTDRISPVDNISRGA